MPIREAAATRRNNFIIRLNDHERDMLRVVAAREQLTASETVRLLVRLAFSTIEPSWPTKRQPSKKVAPAKKAPTGRKGKVATKTVKARKKKAGR